MSVFSRKVGDLFFHKFQGDQNLPWRQVFCCEMRRYLYKALYKRALGAKVIFFWNIDSFQIKPNYHQLQSISISTNKLQFVDNVRLITNKLLDPPMWSIFVVYDVIYGKIPVSRWCSSLPYGSLCNDYVKGGSHDHHIIWDLVLRSELIFTFDIFSEWL